MDARGLIAAARRLRHEYHGEYCGLCHGSGSDATCPRREPNPWDSVNEDDAKTVALGLADELENALTRTTTAKVAAKVLEGKRADLFEQAKAIHADGEEARAERDALRARLADELEAALARERSVQATNEHLANRIKKMFAPLDAISKGEQQAVMLWLQHAAQHGPESVRRGAAALLEIVRADIL